MTFLAGLIGAVLGAAATGVVSYFVLPKVQQEVRKRERSENALERLLEAAEGDHWPRVVAYGYKIEERSQLVMVGATVPTIRRKEAELMALTIELQESVRQLRLYTPRVRDEAVVKLFDAYMNLTLRAAALVGFMAMFASPPPEPNLVDAKSLEDSLVALLRAANEALSCEWRDPREVIGAVEDDGPA